MYKQWGFTNESPFILPISFSIIFGGVSAQTNGNDERHVIVTAYNPNKIEYKLRGYSSHQSMESTFWIAIGR